MENSSNLIFIFFNNTISPKELDANDVISKDSSSKNGVNDNDIKDDNTEERDDIIIDKTPPIVPVETDSEKEEGKDEEYIHPEPILFGEVEESKTSKEVDGNINLTDVEKNETTKKIQDDTNLTHVEEVDNHHLPYVKDSKTTEKVEDHINLKETEQKEINKIKKDEDEDEKEKLIKLLIESRYPNNNNSSKN